MDGINAPQDNGRKPGSAEWSIRVSLLSVWTEPVFLRRFLIVFEVVACGSIIVSIKRSRLAEMASSRQTHDFTMEDLDDKVVPGTIHLVDKEHILRTKHSQAHQDVVLVPTPSNDPDDPLNWSPRRKALSAACWIVYTLINGIANSVVYSVLVPLSESLDITVGDLNAGTGYLFLLAGYGLLLWQPFALQYGKRPTYLISTLGILGMTIWGPYAHSNGQWIAKNILGGFFAAPIEALPELSVTDVYFSHERGTYLAVYALALVGSNYFAPVICGWINDGQGYKWVFYWPTIFCAVVRIKFEQHSKAITDNDSGFYLHVLLHGGDKL